MSFPVTRPEDVDVMADVERLARLEWLRSEIAAAARRHTEILTARLRREQAERQPAGVELHLPVAVERSADQQEADLVLARHRLLVAMGRGQGDGSRADDLRAAHAAVAAGSINPVLRGMEQEYQRWRKALSRGDSYASRQSRRPAVPDRRAS